MKKNILLASAAVAATGFTLFMTHKRKVQNEGDYVKQKSAKKHEYSSTQSMLRSNAYLYDLYVYDDRPE